MIQKKPQIDHIKERTGVGFTAINSKEDPTERNDRKNSTGIQEKRKLDNIRGKIWVDFTRVK